jgi:purine nucleoside phosphorylase
MRVGVITGSGTHALPGFDGAAPESVSTRWGDTAISRGALAGVDVVHVSRHGEGHVRLSNHVTHRANIAALRDAGCACVVAVTVCGAADPSVALGSLMVFDDLHFVSNRLADGSLCTFHDQPGGEERAHWIYEDPYSPELRRALVEGARAAEVEARDGGCYGHVDGPRFNTKAEIRGLAACGVTAVSQTAGPETVLCGEAGLPFALLGYATDYANGVQAEATPVERLLELIAASTETFGRVLSAALSRIDASSLASTGVNYKFHGR